MHFPDRVQLPFAFDAAHLRRDLDALSRLVWIDHFVRQNYEGSWSVLPLRGPQGARHPVQSIYPNPSAASYADTAYLEHAPYIRNVLEAFSCPLQCVRLMRLGPGSMIKEHRDHDLSFEEGHARIHIPVTTNPDVTFALNGSRVNMAPGSAWYLRLCDPHRVQNLGRTDRVHLVVDAVANDWLATLLEQVLA